MPENNDALVNFADELLRLSKCLVRDIRRDSELPCLSTLTAMRPLHQMIIEALTNQLNEPNQSDLTKENHHKNPIGFSK
jgi:hypothetical protein